MHRRRPSLGAYSLLVLLACGAAAQDASLVLDINTIRDGDGYTEMGLQLVAVGQSLFFTREDESSGNEVWVSDGTAYGTGLLFDSCPGPCSSHPVLLGATRDLVFWAAQGEGELRLWRSDGTRHGTFQLGPQDLSVGPYTPYGRVGAALIGDILFFTGCTPALGCELWRSDGTPAGTALVADIRSGTDSSFLAFATRVAGKLFFVAQRESGHFALWTSDGTAGGTAAIEDLDDTPLAVVATADRLFFVHRSESSGAAQLWTSDGTAAGTRQVTNFAGRGGVLGYTDVTVLHAIGSRVYFVADNGVEGQEIWRSDGTPQGTVRLTDLRNRAPFAEYRPLDLAEVAGGRLVFVAKDGERYKLWSTSGPSQVMSVVSELCLGGCHELEPRDALIAVGGARALFSAAIGSHGRELWSTDGTSQGTTLVADICSGPCSGLSAGPFRVGGAAFIVGFERGRDSTVSNLWRTDGTSVGTRRFTHFAHGGLDESELRLALRGSEVFFTAEANTGRELWVGDGTPAGTRVLTDFGDPYESSRPQELVALGDQVFFTACESSRRRVWRTQGSFGNTAELSAGAHSDCRWDDDALRDFTAVSGRMFFLEERSFYEFDVWVSDGTPEGTAPLADLPTEVSRRGLAAFQGGVVFAAHQPSEHALWHTNGTTDGTRKLYDLPHEIEVESVRYLTSLGAEMYFTAEDSDFGRDVWRSDGTLAGTRKVTDLAGTFNYESDPEFTRVHDRVYFIAQEAGRAQLWRTDGTLAGSTLVHAAGNSRIPAAVRELTVFAGSLFFFGDAEAGPALWRSDGTSGETSVVQAFSASNAAASDLTVLAGTLFFVADDGIHGHELWRSDGTTEGTSMVRDILPGSASSGPKNLVAAGDRLFFAAGDGVHGWELWQSDGTEQGTRLAQDIAPGPSSSHPEKLTVAGGRLYFSADDGLTGRELWVLDLAHPADVCVPSDTALCLSGRFRVEVKWWSVGGQFGIGHAVPLTADTGAFWFFGPENLEVILKVLDGRGLNQHHWVFYGALSSVEYALTVTDVQTGLTARYWNPSGQLASVADTTGFGPLGAFSVVERSTSGPPPRIGAETAATGPCQPAATRLCLRGGRFAVEATWKDFSGNTGVGSAVALTGDTGYFWFFGADNVEVVLKVLDGTPVNGKHWVFYGALSSVEYTLRVTDTATGAVKTYTNKSGNLASVADTGAF